VSQKLSSSVLTKYMNNRVMLPNISQPKTAVCMFHISKIFLVIRINLCFQLYSFTEVILASYLCYIVICFTFSFF